MGKRETKYLPSLEMFAHETHALIIKGKNSNFTVEKYSGDNTLTKCLKLTSPVMGQIDILCVT